MSSTSAFRIAGAEMAPGTSMGDVAATRLSTDQRDASLLSVIHHFLAAEIGENRMLAVLEFGDLIWIAIIAAGAAWYFGVDERAERIEAKLDRILKHLERDDDEPTPP